MDVRWKALGLIATAVSAACMGETPAPSTALGEQQRAGCLTWGFENAFFLPATGNGKERWWIAGVPDNFQLWLNAVSDTSDQKVMFARVIATVSSRGEYGHLGMASREILISEVLELRPFETSDGSCGQEPPPPVPPPDSFQDP